MRDALTALADAIACLTLPNTYEDLLAILWDDQGSHFAIQETYILDYKDKVPSNLNSGYGAGLLRLALAFYNTYGGVILIGVDDKTRTIIGVTDHFDIEAFNRALSDFSGHFIECVSKTYTDVSTGKRLAAVLVPKRGIRKPAALIQTLDKYEIGTTWLRERHEVVRAATRHLPLLYSERSSSPSETAASIFPVHRSLPPSPATVKEFVNRSDLLTGLWDWFVFDDQPRLYLHGAGGSGKSTLAFEFAHSLAQYGHMIRSPSGDPVDYIIFLSAKETELNSYSASEQPFIPRNFHDAEEQFHQILSHSGLASERPTEQEISSALNELFNNFSGLIVIDDIDALSRKSLETGEETLFIKAIRSSKTNKLLYTLRFPPSHALSSSKHVSGLNDTEFEEFLDACCAQFNVPKPSSEIIPLLRTETSSLPLLVEVVIGLRRLCSNYSEALNQFKDSGGDEARRYLYQREYDKLRSDGRSRQVLAALYLLEEPVDIQTFSGLFQFPIEQVRDAISECSSIFLSTFDDQNGNTLYQLAPSASFFIDRVSRSLFYFSRLEAHVKHFRSSKEKLSPQERALFTSFNKLIREGKFKEILATAEALPTTSTALINPNIKSLVGQAYAEMGPDFRERARECFRHCEGLNYRDPFMMRRWFNLEYLSGYGLKEAERICDAVISDNRLPPRTKSEFWSKKGSVELKSAQSISSASREKYIDHIHKSILCYMEGLWLASTVKNMDSGDNLVWLDRPIKLLIMEMNTDFSLLFRVIDDLIQQKHDIEIKGARMLVTAFSTIQIPANAGIKNKFKGLSERTISKILKRHSAIRPSGIDYLYRSLQEIHSLL